MKTLTTILKAKVDNQVITSYIRQNNLCIKPVLHFANKINILFETWKFDRVKGHSDK